MKSVDMKQLAKEIIAMGQQDKWYKRWRNTALLLLLILGYHWLSGPAPDRSHIAMINIDEAISMDSLFWDQFERIDPKDTKAVFILMNSPGGTVGDSERLYHTISRVQKHYPTALLVENYAASGGYLGSLGADKITAYNTAVIGSIGVVSQYWILKDVLEKMGIRQEMLTTGANKGYPSLFSEMPEHVRTNLQNLLDSDNEWFLSIVRERRGLNEAQIKMIKEAQVYSARDALSIGLIDEISTRDEQLEVLRAKVGSLPVKDLSIDEDDLLGIGKLLHSQRKAMMSFFSSLRFWIG